MLNMRFRPKTGQRTAIRRLLSLATLVSFALSFVPMSIPQPTETKDTSAPFPCQNRPCGCQSAEQCWKSCCCFSNQEKLAWAKSEGVQLPAYVAKAAAREQRESCVAKQDPEVPDQQDCCHAEPGSNSKAAACCDTAEVHPQTVAGAERSCQAKQTAAESDLRDAATESKTVLGIFVQECRGQGHGVNSLPWAVVPQLPIVLGHEPPANWPRPASLCCRTMLAEPPEPPPRLPLECLLQDA